ncbi:hypothetical protein GCM10027446_28000 [Angustibacter peucedani]
MRTWRQLNLALAFVVELAALAAVCLAGFSLDRGIGVRLLVGVGGPLVMAALWGYFASPKAPHPLKGLRGGVFRVVWFGVAALALAGSGHPGWGVALMVVYLANAAVLRLTEPAPVEAL